MTFEKLRQCYSWMREEGHGPPLAAYQAFRAEIFHRTGFFNLLDNLLEQDYQVIANETNPKKLGSRALVGALEFRTSYLTILGGATLGILTSNPYLVAASGVLGILTNWDGEFKMVNFGRRCKELGLSVEEVIASSYRGKNILRKQEQEET